MIVVAIRIAFLINMILLNYNNISETSGMMVGECKMVWVFGKNFLLVRIKI